MKISIILSLSFLVSSAFASEQKYSEYIQLERDKNFTTPGIVRSCDGKIGLLDYLWVSRYSGVHLRYEGTGWPWKDILGSLLNDLEAVDSIQGGLVKDIANDLSANFRIEEGIASEVLQVGRCKFLKVFHFFA